MVAAENSVRSGVGDYSFVRSGVGDYSLSDEADFRVGSVNYL